MKKTLQEINQETLSIFNDVEIAEGELTPELAAALTINKGELASKGISYIEVMEDRASLNNRIDIEIKRLQAIKKSNDRLIDRLSYNLLEAQKIHGDFKCGFKTVTTRSSQSIVVEDVNSLPKEYKVTKIVETPNKNKLTEAIKAGKKIKGVSLVDNKNLKIK